MINRALHQAIVSNNLTVESLTGLVAEGADVNNFDHELQFNGTNNSSKTPDIICVTPLMVAVEYNNMDALSLLLKHAH